MNTKYAIVTGASTGIGRELAILAAGDGYDLLLAADTAGLVEVAARCRAAGATVDTLEVDLATQNGVDQLYAVAQGRAVDALFANAGHGLGGAFLDQDFDDLRHVIDTNVTGTIHVIQQVARDMVALGQGRILITGSIAGFVPGGFHAVYNGTKAFVDSFSYALRNELRDTGVTVTCLMPGATETAFFGRAEMLDTKVATEEKDDPAEVAKAGFEAMQRGEADVVAGWKNTLTSAVANITPADMLAEQHRKMAEAGTGKRRGAGTS